MQTLFQENRHTLKLAFPIVVSHLGQMLLGLTDTVMIGHLGTVELAAVALTNNLIHLVMVVGIGLAVAVSVQVSHAHGGEAPDRCRDALAHGLLLSVVLGTLLWLIMARSLPFLDWIRQPPEVLRVLPGYLGWVAPSMSLMMPIMVMKSYAESRNRPWGVFWIQLAGVFLNIGLNACLIFGTLGFPALGLAGAGLATFISRLLTLIGMAVYLNRGTGIRALGSIRPRLAGFRELGVLSTPITAQMMMEFGAFSASAFLIGQLGSLPLAAHQIAFICASTSYMIPFGLSQAAGIRVGHALGADCKIRCRRILIGAQAMTLCIMGSFGLLYLTAGARIASAFTSDPELIALTASLLSIAGVFQMFDGVQVVSVAALRAMKDVKIPTLLSFSGYWLAAFPLGVWLGLGLERGVTGFWTGLAAGLGIAACSMSLRLIWMLRKT